MPATPNPGYTVKLEVFEGPLDLLLHLIRREEMDIYDIPIARITQQYLEHLDSLATLDLDTASEFLLMAATLMDIKSRMLLPRPPAGEFIDEEAQADPRTELVARLLEYRRYKEAAGDLSDLFAAARRRHSRFGGPGGQLPAGGPAGTGGPGREGSGQAPGPSEGSGGPGASPGGEGYGPGGAGPGGAPGVPLTDLVAALQQVLRELEERPPAEIARETLTVADKIAEIVPALLCAGDKGLDFTAFLRRQTTRRAVVVTFLAFLELLRQGRVRFAQPATFGPITVWALPHVEEWGWPGRD